MTPGGGPACVRFPRLRAAPTSALALALALMAPGCDRQSPRRSSGGSALVAADLTAVVERLGPGGEIRVVNFWATWCQPCIEELVEFVALDSAHRQSGIEVIGISLDLAMPGERSAIAQRVQSFLGERGIGYENLLYTGSVPHLLDALDLPGPIPYTLVVGRDGRVRWRHEGKTTRAEVEAALRAAADRESGA